MKEFAIFNYSGIGKNQGGPTGYLYNLVSGLEKIKVHIPLISVKQEGKVDKNVNAKSLPIILEELRAILYYIKKGIVCSKIIDNNIHDYKIIHVHSCEDVFYLRKFVKFTGIILLTSHRPQPLSDEVIFRLQQKFRTSWKFPILKLLMDKIEKFGYKESAGYIFPTIEAMKIYRKFPGYTSLSRNKPISYVFTGVPKLVPNISSEEYRKRLSISKLDKVICFIGRHNYIKGYDLLTDLADRFEKNNIKVVCAGENNLLPSPRTSNWLELGHIKDPYNLINAADLVVIPNRNTFFDLIIVEVLSLGKIVVTSDNGGNLDIAKFTRGVCLFKSGDKESLYQTIIKVLHLSDAEKKQMAEENLQFYENHCTPERFAINYLNTINNILKFLKGEK